MALGERSSSNLVTMIVDDDAVDQMVYQRVFSRSNVFGSVIGCSMGEEALARLRDLDKEPIDILFLDISMPRMNGFEFLEAGARELGEQFKKITVVMLTTSLDEADMRRVRQFPQVKAYLSKPLTNAALDSLILQLGLSGH